MQLLCLVLYAFVYFPAEISGARILAMFAYPGKSHWDFYRPLMIALAEKGHEVTVVGHFPQRPALPRYTDISLSGTFKNIQKSINIEELIEKGKYKLISQVWDVHGYETCDKMYKNQKIQDLARSKVKYDLLITELFGGDCFHPFAHKFNIPLIGITSGSVQPFIADFINLPENPSYIPSYAVPFTNDMNFIERTINTVALVGCKLGYHFVSRQKIDSMARTLFPDMPPLLEISNNISLVMSNTHYSLDGARPGLPALVEVGGMHIKENRVPLPYNLQEILDKAVNGVVYFSFGSLAKSETLPIESLDAMVYVFGKLKQDVLWTVDGPLEGYFVDLPTNVIMEPFVPQLDVLCHPNVIAFITHGGILSTQEATYCAVPMIGIPLLPEDEHTIKNLEPQGHVLYLNVHNITESSMAYALKEVLENSNYIHNARRMSDLFRNRPMKALDEAVYWTEYVIKHGGTHLQTSAKNLNWIQYLLLDVSAAFCFVLLVIAIPCLIFIRWMCSFLRPRRGNNEQSQA